MNQEPLPGNTDPSNEWNPNEIDAFNIGQLKEHYYSTEERDRHLGIVAAQAIEMGEVEGS